MGIGKFGFQGYCCDLLVILIELVKEECFCRNHLKSISEREMG